MKKSIALMSILSIILVVFVSGCTSESQTYNLNNTFSKEGLSFNYPSDWKEIQSKILSGDDNNTLIVLGSPDNKTKIAAYYSELTDNSDGTIEDIKNYAKSSIGKNTDAKFLTDTTINITGASEAYECIYTSTDPNNNEFRKGYYIFFGEQGKYYYGMQIWGLNESFSNTRALYDKVLPTIKIQ